MWDTFNSSGVKIKEENICHSFVNNPNLWNITLSG